MSCQQQVVDVFITKNSTDYLKDEEWQAPVWSIQFDTISTPYAFVVAERSPWVMSCDPDTVLDLEVGDVVRVGTPETEGYTDYLTVLEKKLLDNIANGTPANISYGSTTLTTQSTTADGITTVNNVGVSFIGVHATYAYRLNIASNVTTVRAVLPRFGLLSDSDQITKMLENRHLAVNEADWADTDAKKLPYPLFKVNKVGNLQRNLRIDLDKSIKYTHWIQLAGYTIATKRHVGYQNAHEMHNDDFFILHVDQVHGQVLSNNQHANGSFCVLHAGHAEHHQNGTIEYHHTKPGGIATQILHGQQCLRQLSVRLTDRTGKVADFGRIHLWFKLCVSHG